MNINKRKVVIFMLAIIGLVLTVKLAVIYYYANYVKYSLSSFCSINEFIDCDGAARTTVSQFWGIPLAYWGMMFYLTTMFLLVVDKLKNIKFLRFLSVFKNPMSYIAVIGTFAFVVSMILACTSIFVIKKLCILCVITYLIDFMIALSAVKDWSEYINSYKNIFFDFIAGAKQYPKTLAVLLVIAIAFFTTSAQTDMFIPHLRKSKEIRKYYSMKDNPYKINGNLLGVENADVVVNVYSDYQCPMCFIQNIMLHKAAKQYKNLKVIHHNLPFDKECNPELTFSAHPGSCYLSKASLAAGKMGNYWGMNTILFHKKPMNDEAIKPYLKELGLDEQKFFEYMNSKEISDELQKEIDDSEKLGLDSTPTIYVNEEQHVGMLLYEDLQKMLEKHGAKKR